MSRSTEDIFRTARERSIRFGITLRGPLNNRATAQAS